MVRRLLPGGYPRYSCVQHLAALLRALRAQRFPAHPHDRLGDHPCQPGRRCGAFCGQAAK